MNRSPMQGLRRLGLTLLAGALALLHGRLLWQRLAEGSFFDPTVIARWAASGLLLGGLVWVYRHCGSLFRGREAAVLWTLVLLLHALAGVPAGDLVAESAPWMALPLGIVALGAVALVLGGSGWQAARPDGARALSRIVDTWSPSTGHAGVLGSRAPPR